LEEVSDLHASDSQREFLSVSLSSTHVELCLAELSILANSLMVEYLDHEVVFSFFQSEFERFVPDKALWSGLVTIASCT
jgi:hypothetical protein